MEFNLHFEHVLLSQIPTDGYVDVGSEVSNIRDMASIGHFRGSTVRPDRGCFTLNRACWTRTVFLDLRFKSYFVQRRAWCMSTITALFYSYLMVAGIRLVFISTLLVTSEW